MTTQKTKQDISAIILAGGLGSRLRPFTYSIPKPLIKVKGKPIIEYIIENLHKHKINNIILAVDYKAHKIEDYLGYGKRYNVNLTYCHKTGHLGTGGAIKTAFNFAKLKNLTIIVNGDNIANYDFTKMLKEHIKNKAQITLATTKVNNVSQYGLVKIRGKKIIDFIEKPENKIKPRINTINAGAYILNPEIITKIPTGKVSIEKDLFQKKVKLLKIFAFEHKYQWFPTDNFERFYIANKKLNVKAFNNI